MAADESVDEAKKAISSIPKPEIVRDVPFELVTHHERKTTKLLSTSGASTPINGRHKAVEFNFAEPLFVDRILIHTSGYVASEFEVEWTGTNGITKKSSARRQGDTYQCDVVDLATSLAFIPARTLLTDPLINSVQIFGFRYSQIPEVIDYARDVEVFSEEAIDELEAERSDLAKRRSALEALEATRGSLSQDIAKFKSQSATEQNKIKKLALQHNELITKNGDLERTIAEAESRLQLLSTEVTRHSRIRGSLAKSIEDKRKELGSLQANINLFPSEISGFADQGATNVELYTRIAALPMFIIAVLFVMLLAGAADLTTKIAYDSTVNIPVLIVSRAPYVIVSLTIITACYYLARTFVLEIIRVNRQKLNLTKISVISKDVSYALEEGLDLTTSEKYDRRLRLKMDLMRDHLKDYISKDFEPSLPERIGAASFVPTEAAEKSE